MLRAISAAAVSLLIAGGAHANVVDFEDEAPLSPDPTNESTSYSNGGITFDSLDGNDLFLVQTGTPTNAFVPNDDPSPGGAFGEVFLTGDFIANSAMGLTFDKDLNSISFDIADIDGSGEQAEIFTFEFLFNGSSLSTITKQAGVDADTGDGVITPISFGGQRFDQVLITNRTVGEADGSNRPNIGWGIDNINASPVPVPAGVVLLVSGLGGLAFMRRRKSADA